MRPLELRGGISLYYKGSKRKDIQLKQDLGLEILEGNKPMYQEVFIFLAKKPQARRKSIYFARLFLILDW